MLHGFVPGRSAVGFRFTAFLRPATDRSYGCCPRTTARCRSSSLMRASGLAARLLKSFALKVNDLGINRRRVVQQMIVLAFKVFVEEGERAGSDRLANRPGSGGRIRC